MEAPRPRRTTRARPWAAILLTSVLIGACGGETPSPTSTTSAAANSRGASSPAAAASPSDAPSAATDPFVGQAVVTVSPDLRVRSQPRVASDSAKYEPLLPSGTELTVIGGPVAASGYTWYQVMPVDVTLGGGHTSGWVAAGDKDGTPWIALRTAPGPTAELAISTAPRAPAELGKAKKAATSVNAFGLDLYKRMLADGTLDPTKGAVFSPTSIALALGMARAGAKGETAKQMDEVLHTPGWEALGPGLNALDQELSSRNQTWQAADLNPPTRQVALRIANASFAQRDWSIEQAYLDQLASTFGAGLRLVDYRKDLEGARQTVNAWVDERTKGRIPELVPAGALDPLTRLVLVNAIYMKAAWAHEFWETKPRAFTRLDGSTTQPATMFQNGQQEVPYARGTGWQAAELRYESPYDSSTGQPIQSLAMTLIVPDDLAAFERGLTASQVARITSALESERTKIQVATYEGDPGDPCGCGCYPYSVDLYLPKFGLQTNAQLTDTLKALGMPLAVTKGVADFSGIHVPKSYAEILYIQDVIHQANIDVDELGTEAAAATAVFMGDTGGGCVGSDPVALKTVTLRLDHPFLFVLRDLPTGAILFMGRVVDPSQR